MTERCAWVVTTSWRGGSTVLCWTAAGAVVALSWPSLLSCLPWEMERMVMRPIRASKQLSQLYNRWIFRPHCAVRTKVLGLRLGGMLADTCVYVSSSGRPVIRSRDGLPSKSAGAVRAVVISDTHLQQDRFGTLPEGDVLIHAGDVLRRSSHLDDSEARLAEFGRWLSKQPQPRKLLVAGNHDAGLEAMSLERIQEILGNDVEYCLDTCVEIHGVRAFLSPFSASNSPRSGNRAFQSKSRRDTFVRAVNAAGRIDLLVTHGPPRGVLDSGVGSTAIAQAVQDHRPRYHVFGHQHNAFGAAADRDGTVFVNASSCDGLFALTRPPCIIDIEPLPTPIGGPRAPGRVLDSSAGSTVSTVKVDYVTAAVSVSTTDYPGRHILGAHKKPSST